MKMDTVLECPTKYACISASGRKLIVHYEKDYSLFLSYLKPESLMFKSFTRILYFNHLKMVTGWDVLGNEWGGGTVFTVTFGVCVVVHPAVGPLHFAFERWSVCCKTLKSIRTWLSSMMFHQAVGLIMRNIFKDRILI